ncbi:MAG: DUF4157 domain-containing protein [Chitinophagaceae bacterium]
MSLRLTHTLSSSPALQQNNDAMHSSFFNGQPGKTNDQAVSQPVIQPSFIPPQPVQRQCAHCEQEEKKMQRKEQDKGAAGVDNQFENYVSNLSGAGAPLPNDVRNYYEPRFGYDFSNVRVHTDSVAAKSAQSINAQAYTTGNNIVFNKGHYAPGTDSGKKLLAHELTHVIQQNGSIGRKIQRAVVRVANQNVQIDYGPVIGSVDYAGDTQARIATYTGAAANPATVSALTALTPVQQRWVLYGLAILMDNTTAAHAALNRTNAVDRLIAHAPGAAFQPMGNIANAKQFAREVLTTAGWTEVAVATSLTAPGAADVAAINTIVNPTGASGGGVLDVTALQTRLVPALRAVLTTLDPGNWTAVGTRSISTFQTLGNLIITEAREFFSPYADAAMGNIFDLSPAWQASANIFDVTATVPTRGQRINHLLNRAELVGRNSSSNPPFIDTNIFSDVNFDSSRPADRTELLNIVNTMEADVTLQPVLNRLVKHTGRQSGRGAATTIGLVTEFNAGSLTSCADHWKGIDTLCHELLHALVHPNFFAAATRIGFSQIVREGFTEVLGNQLFNDRIRKRVAREPAFKATMEAGAPGAPCPAPAAGTIGYGDAGSGAEAIRLRVHDDNFRAAYFLGRTDLVGF